MWSKNLVVFNVIHTYAYVLKLTITRILTTFNLFQDGEECSTVFVKKCEDKSENVCADVTETKCEVGTAVNVCCVASENYLKIKEPSTNLLLIWCLYSFVIEIYSKTN